MCTTMCLIFMAMCGMQASHCTVLMMSSSALLPLTSYTCHNAICLGGVSYCLTQATQCAAAVPYTKWALYVDSSWSVQVNTVRPGHVATQSENDATI